MESHYCGPAPGGHAPTPHRDRHGRPVNACPVTVTGAPDYRRSLGCRTACRSVVHRSSGLVLSGHDSLIVINTHRKAIAINTNTATAQRSTSKADVIARAKDDRDVVAFARDDEKARKEAAEKRWNYGKAIVRTLAEENTKAVQAQRVKDGEKPEFRQADLARELVAEGIYKNENTAKVRISQVLSFYKKYDTLAQAIAGEPKKKKEERKKQAPKKGEGKTRKDAEDALKKKGYPTRLRNEILADIFG